MTRLLSLCCLLLVGCITLTDKPDAYGYRWFKERESVTPIYHYDVDVYLNCMFEEKAEACSIRREDGCHIYLPDDYPLWLKEHEEKHCAGWNHS